MKRFAKEVARLCRGVPAAGPTAKFEPRARALGRLCLAYERALGASSDSTWGEGPWGSGLFALLEECAYRATKEDHSLPGACAIARRAIHEHSGDLAILDLALSQRAL